MNSQWNSNKKMKRRILNVINLALVYKFNVHDIGTDIVILIEYVLLKLPFFFNWISLTTQC